MKVNEFIKEYGLDEARKFLEVPSYSIDQLMMLRSGLDTRELERLIESHELVEKMGGLEKSKAILNRSPSNAESYQDGYYFRTKPEFLFHNGFHHWNMTTNNGQWFKDLGFNPVLIVDLKQAIADVESCQ
ncbi:hypothetical protein [Acinetobacter pollinis]|uniref:hypothetical protein n=1 Tax=Acinetobacter pollinis TaxID=2605270 RepID=UPI0018C35203|nr:hypothetical protein [Acinetobacter pollinis]MBF7693979.1 hypothetical protein [Acinetobacter pollinis]MBF7701634.1 hypothetical protein [Acinetobacter pollinis]